MDTLIVPIELIEVIISYTDIDTSDNLIKALNINTKRLSVGLIHQYKYGKYKNIGYEEYARSGHLENLKYKIKTLNVYITNVDRGEEYDDTFVSIENMKTVEQLLTVDHLHMYKRDTITKFPKEICYLLNLKRLDIGSCHLTELPQELSLLVNLELVWLMYNELTTPFEVLSELPQLTFLMLHTNKIKYIPSIISKMINLEHIGLGNNKITGISKDLFRLPKLGNVSLYANQLKIDCIPNSLKESKLKFIGLSDNQIDEDKFRKRFNDWIVKNGVYVQI